MMTRESIETTGIRTVVHFSRGQYLGFGDPQSQVFQENNCNFLELSLLQFPRIIACICGYTRVLCIHLSNKKDLPCTNGFN